MELAWQLDLEGVHIRCRRFGTVKACVVERRNRRREWKQAFLSVREPADLLVEVARGEHDEELGRTQARGEVDDVAVRQIDEEPIESTDV